MIPKATLSQRVSVLVAVLVILLMLGNVLLNILTMRSYIEDQLGSHAHDAATSLGLALSSSLTSDDLTLASSYVDSFFDSGDYRFVAVHDRQGQLVFERVASNQINEVPSWFYSTIHLNVAHAEAPIQRGWSSLGTVSLIVHTGYAYQQLWEELTFQLLWALLVVAVGILSLRIVVNIVLKPLNEIESHARLLSSEQSFTKRFPDPKVGELVPVTRALNDMSDRLGHIFDEQLRQIESLRLDKQIDHLTHCWNREAFDARMNALFDSFEDALQGTLFLVQINELNSINQRLGRTDTDALLKAVASVLQDRVSEYADALCARRSGGDFSVFVPSMIEDQADDLAQSILADVANLALVKRLLSDNVVHIGLSGVRVKDDLASLLSRADMALRQAQAQLSHAWQRYSDADSIDAHAEVRAASEWLQILESVMQDRRFSVLQQTVHSDQDTQTHHIYSRIDTHDEKIEASKFLPMARRFGLLADIDSVMLSNALDFIERLDTKDHYVLSISDLSLSQAGYITWLSAQLLERRIDPACITLEVSEYVLKQDESRFEMFCKQMETIGTRVAIAHFGLSGVSLSYLAEFPITHVRTDKWSIRGIDADLDKKQFIQSAVQLTRSKSILLIANGVETEAEYSTLCHLGVNHLMGYYLSKPDCWYKPFRLALDKKVIKVNRKVRDFMRHRAEDFEDYLGGGLLPKLVSLGVIVYLLLAIVLGFWWSSSPKVFDVNAHARVLAEQNNDEIRTGYTTTATLIRLSESLLDKSGGYISNDLFPPGLWLDNIKSWEYGVLVQVRDMARVLRKEMSRSQSQSTEDRDLKVAEPQLHFDNNSWAIPATESEYRRGIKALYGYLSRLSDPAQPQAQFYARADNLRAWLSEVENRLGSLSRRLSESVGRPQVDLGLAGDKNAQQSTPTPGLEQRQTSWFEIDDIFYEARGTTWALIHFLKAIEVDFYDVLVDKNALVSLRQIRMELEATQQSVWSPMILNGSGFGILANHSLTMSSYISRASAAMIDLRSLLQQG